MPVRSVGVFNPLFYGFIAAKITMNNRNKIYARFNIKMNEFRGCEYGE